ncbi:hypothetical protein MHYP_G00262100 [Metynnis hypsauchen]
MGSGSCESVGTLGLTSGYREMLLSGACTEAGARLPSWDFPPRLGVLTLGVWVSRLPGKSRGWFLAPPPGPCGCSLSTTKWSSARGWLGSEELDWGSSVLLSQPPPLTSSSSLSKLPIL